MNYSRICHDFHDITIALLNLFLVQVNGHVYNTATKIEK